MNNHGAGALAESCEIASFAVDIPSLLGDTIDQVKGRLGPPDVEITGLGPHTSAPTDCKAWFGARGGATLYVEYDRHNRRVSKFIIEFAAGSLARSPAEGDAWLRAMGLSRDVDTYTLNVQQSTPAQTNGIGDPWAIVEISPAPALDAVGAGR